MGVGHVQEIEKLIFFISCATFSILWAKFWIKGMMVMMLSHNNNRRERQKHSPRPSLSLSLSLPTSSFFPPQHSLNLCPLDSYLESFRHCHKTWWKASKELHTNKYKHSRSHKKWALGNAQREREREREGKLRVFKKIKSSLVCNNKRCVTMWPHHIH